MASRNKRSLGVFEVASIIMMLGGSIARAQSSEVDWMLFGATTVSDDPSGHVTCFYESKSITTNADGNFKVWAKCLSDKVLDLAKLSKEQRDKIMEYTLLKEAGGYIPPYTRINRVDKDQLVDIRLYEAMATSGQIAAKTEGLYEVNCESRMNRTLNIRVFMNGQYHSVSKVDEWNDIRPSSIWSTLLSMICLPK